MKVAIPLFSERISPVFDVATRLRVITVEQKKETDRAELEFKETEFFSRINKMLDLGIDVLICGAISREMENMLKAERINVIPQICGVADEVIKAYLSGNVFSDRFFMPGCYGRRRRYRHRGMKILNKSNKRFL